VKHVARLSRWIHARHKIRLETSKGTQARVCGNVPVQHADDPKKKKEKKIQTHRLPPTVANCHPLSPAATHCHCHHPLSPTATQHHLSHCHSLSPTATHCHHLSPTVTHYHPCHPVSATVTLSSMSSTVTHCRPLSPTTHCHPLFSTAATVVVPTFFGVGHDRPLALKKNHVLPTALSRLSHD
jgi:hypothetical protein